MVRRESHVLLIACLIVIACWLSLRSVGVVMPTATILLNLRLFALSVAVVCGSHFLYMLWRDRPDLPVQYAARLLRQRRDTALAGLTLLASIAVFMALFSGMKSAIPLFNEFGWDRSFLELDIAIHGTDPWRLLQPVFGYPLVTSALSVFYHLWILLIYIGSVYFAFYVPDRRLVLRYFLSYLLCWSILGIVLATIFASVGPVFMSPILGDDHFVEQIAYLEEADQHFTVWVLPVQEQLLDWYLHGELGLGRGITAMPSMHVALAFLFWLALREVSVLAGRIALAFFFVILIGSVHLAYHYAVDGYASVIGSAVIWWISGKLVASSTDRRDAGSESLSPAE